MSREVCLVTGVGPGTGKALVERFAQTYDVAMLARNTERLNEIEQATVNTKAYTCDVSDTKQLKATLQQVRTELGAPSIVIHNAVGGAFGDFVRRPPGSRRRGRRGFAWRSPASIRCSRSIGRCAWRVAVRGPSDRDREVVKSDGLDVRRSSVFPPRSSVRPE